MSNWKHVAAALLSWGFAPVNRWMGANDKRRPTSGKDRSKAKTARKQSRKDRKK